MSTARRTVEVAEEVAAALKAEGANVAVIGAMALAAHGYVRRTDDFDLATVTDPFGALRRVRDTLLARGLEVELREPDMEDPLGGVLVVEAEGARPLSPSLQPGAGQVAYCRVAKRRHLREVVRASRFDAVFL